MHLSLICTLDNSNLIWVSLGDHSPQKFHYIIFCMSEEWNSFKMYLGGEEVFFFTGEGVLIGDDLADGESGVEALGEDEFSLFSLRNSMLSTTGTTVVWIISCIMGVTGLRGRALVETSGNSFDSIFNFSAGWESGLSLLSFLSSSFLEKLVFPLAGTKICYIKERKRAIQF